MATCYIGPDIKPGLEEFKKSFSESGDFVTASQKAVKYLNENDVMISQEEFNVFAENNLKELIGKDPAYLQNKTKEVKRKLAQVEANLGIKGERTLRTLGKFKGVKLSAEAQEQLQLAIDVAFGSIDPQSAASTSGELIGIFIRDGILYNDVNRLESALYLITQLKKKGKIELTKKAEDRKANIRKKADEAASAVSRLSIEKQDAKAKVLAYAKGELDWADIADDVKNILGVKVDGTGQDPNAVAIKILNLIESKEKPLWSSFLTKARRKLSEGMMWENFDLGSFLSKIDNRGAAKYDGGILETLIHDPIRRADQEIRIAKDEGLKRLAIGLEKILGKKFEAGKSWYSSVVDSNRVNQAIKDEAQKSKRLIRTQTILKDGSLWRPTAGEVAQLYLDSFNPSHARSIEAAGVSAADLKKAVAQLSKREIDFAKFIRDEFYPYLLAKENETHKTIYDSNLPYDSSYGGPVSYTGDKEVDNVTDPNGDFRRKQVNIALSNSTETGSESRPINLNRNIFSNVLNRLDNSSKFTGGAQTYNEVHGILNDPKFKKELQTAQIAGDYIGQRLNSRLDSTLGLSTTTPALPSILATLTSNITFVALAAKPKLLLNQVTSAVFWTTEASTFRGSALGRVLDSKANDYVNELKDTDGSVVQSMFNNSPILKARYSANNLIGLTSALDEVEIAATALEKSSKFKEQAAKMMMSPTLVGDAVGVFFGGKQFYQGEYIKLRKQGKTIEQAKKEAGYRFGKQLSKTQQSFLKVDKSDMQNSEYRLFTKFQTTPRQFRRIVSDDLRQIYRALDPRKESKGSVAYHVMRAAMFHSISGMAYYTVMQALPAFLLGDEEDEEKAWDGIWLAAATGSYYGSIFIFGSIFEAIHNKMVDAPFSSDIGDSPAWLKMNKAKDAFIKWHEYSQKNKLTASQQIAMERAQWNSWVYLSEVFGAPTTNVGLKKGYDGEVSLVKLYDEIEKGNWDEAEFLLRRAGYSEYQLREIKEKEQKKKKRKGPIKLGSGIKLNKKGIKLK